MPEGAKTVVSNRRARYEYALEAPIEAGMVLEGSEVKSLRAGQATLAESFVDVRPEGVDLVGCHITPYDMARNEGYVPTRRRRLLLNKNEIAKLRKGVEQKGYTVVPLQIYFKNGRAKLQIALGKGKKLHDKRNSIAERESQRRIDREMRDR
ncbi:SsrA-binding protein SmpB [Rubricoccus marinus]|uniref:SsrA-binding protein n=1 Tax=Rubricoccus marinus TaxID=716817 RepID=A0A259TZQ9_9BACT|nr:SsrA-binding protein SmpB [Rubricoccus marinus]OZC03166.1 SsrA-binding protein [Rubricoccus marinus]